MRSQFALGHQLDKKLQHPFFVGRRHDGIGAFDPLIAMIDAQGRVLPSLKLKRPAGINTYQPQILREVLTLDHACGEVLVRGENHLPFPSSSEFSRSSCPKGGKGNSSVSSECRGISHGVRTVCSERDPAQIVEFGTAHCTPGWPFKEAFRLLCR